MVDIKVTVGTPPEARENANDQVAFTLTFECYWLSGWSADQSRSKMKQSQSNPRLRLTLKW